MKVEEKELKKEEEEALSVVWVTHNFKFLGGSLGCAEGEKVTRYFNTYKSHPLTKNWLVEHSSMQAKIDFRL